VPLTVVGEVNEYSERVIEEGFGMAGVGGALPWCGE
jgi:hypothetical protein